MSKQRAELVTESKQNVVQFIKNRIFDFLGIAILVAMSALMLNVVEGKPFTWQSIKEVLVQLVPFYICAMALSLNYYKKGSYNAKETESFHSTLEDYTDETDSLDGDKISRIKDFCNEYNAEELKNMQINILRSEGVTYDQFVEYRKLTYFALRKAKGRLVAKVVYKAKRAKIVGIDTNSLLGNHKSADNTDLGPNESQMLTGRSVAYALTYVATIGFLVFIGVKDINDWRWYKLLYELSKVIYIFVRSYMRYFEGFEDITIKLANTIHRKTDTLKAFNSWYDKHKDDAVTQMSLFDVTKDV